MRLLVDQLLDTLPEREAEIMRLRFYEELTQSQIAERLGISQMHVSRLMRRCLVDLRATLDG
jgi:RNA polymerase sigma-B factor